MTDNVSRRTRSRIMAGIPTSGSSPERRVRAILLARRARFFSPWSLRFSKFNVSVDFYLPLERLAIFVDGCLWHGHGHALRGSTFTSIWRRKIAVTVARDARNTKYLLSAGVRVLRLWECEIDAGRIAAAITGART